MRGLPPTSHQSSCTALAIALLALLTSCSPKRADERTPPKPHEAGVLCRVGSIVIYQTDLDRELKERHADINDQGAAKKALAELVTRAQFAAAALDAGFEKDPSVRAEIARILASVHKANALNPRTRELAAPIPEPQLRELYQREIARFQSAEKRQIAVLWLNPNGSPEREKQYTEKLTAAREWFGKSGDIKDHPKKGFSVLSVDHSEHAASRYKGGVIGWLTREGGMDTWTKAVAEIAFSLKEPGEVSTVTIRPEGIFLVRYMELQPAILRSFEDVASELERAERQRLRAAAEAEFEAAIRSKYPALWPADSVSADQAAQ